MVETLAFLKNSSLFHSAVCGSVYWIPRNIPGRKVFFRYICKRFFFIEMKRAVEVYKSCFLQRTSPMDERPNCKKFSKEKVFTFVFSLKEVIWTNKCFRYDRWYSLCHIKGTFGVTIVSYYLRLSIYHNVQIWQTRHRWEPFIWNMRYVQSFPNVLACFIIPGRFHEYMYTGKQ